MNIFHSAILLITLHSIEFKQSVTKKKKANRILTLSDLPPFSIITKFTPTFAKPVLRRVYLPVFCRISTFRFVRLLLNLLSKPISHPDVNTIHNYWREPDSGNLPETYIDGEVKSQFLLEIIQRHAKKNIKVLEIGCNVGRNLNYLYKAGFVNLEGIEISTNAVKLLKQTYPDMANHTKIYNEPVETIITEFRDGQYDLVFTMAVLLHIHTESEWIFPQMARITNDLLITIEAEWGEAWKRFPRNYKNIFEPLGMKQVEKLNCGKVGFDLTDDYVARVFKKFKKL